MTKVKLKKYSNSIAYKLGDGKTKTASATWIPYGHMALDKLSTFKAQESLAEAVANYDYSGLLLTSGVDDVCWRWVYLPTLEFLENGFATEIEPPFITYLGTMNILDQEFANRNEAKAALELALEIWDLRP